MSVDQAASQSKTNADTACWAIHRPNGFSYMFAPTNHDFTLIHKAFACQAKEIFVGTDIAHYLPKQRRVPLW